MPQSHLYKDLRRDKLGAKARIGFTPLSWSGSAIPSRARSIGRRRFDEEVFNTREIEDLSPQGEQDPAGSLPKRKARSYWPSSPRPRTPRFLHRAAVHVPDRQVLATAIPVPNQATIENLQRQLLNSYIPSNSFTPPPRGRPNKITGRLGSVVSCCSGTDRHPTAPDRIPPQHRNRPA